MKRKIDNLLRVIGAVLLVLSIWKPQYAPVHHAWGMLDQAYDVIELLFAGIRWLMDRIRAGK